MGRCTAPCLEIISLLKGFPTILLSQTRGLKVLLEACGHWPWALEERARTPPPHPPWEPPEPARRSSLENLTPLLAQNKPSPHFLDPPSQSFCLLPALLLARLWVHCPSPGKLVPSPA